MASVRRKIENGAVLGDDDVEASEIAGDPPEIIQTTPRGEDYRNAGVRAAPMAARISAGIVPLVAMVPS